MTRAGTRQGLQRRKSFARAPRRGHQGQIGAQGRGKNRRAHRRRRLAAALAQRTFMIGQRRIVPGRFRVAQQEKLARHASLNPLRKFWPETTRQVAAPLQSPPPTLPNRPDRVDGVETQDKAVIGEKQAGKHPGGSLVAVEKAVIASDAKGIGGGEACSVGIFVSSKILRTRQRRFRARCDRASHRDRHAPR